MLDVGLTAIRTLGTIRIMSTSEGGPVLHPISVVAERTGLSADVLRVWERRYGVVSPVRDDAGRRLYSDADVERLRLLASATAGGRTISQVSGLAFDELIALVRADESSRWATSAADRQGRGDDAPDIVERALTWTRAMDASALEAELTRGAAVMGSARFPDLVMAPLFQRVGEGWHRGELSIAQEHLATASALAVMRQVLGALPAEPDAPALLVATMSGERHEIGALLAATVAASEGWRVVYMGSDLPVPEIADAAVRTGVRAVGVSVVLAVDIEQTTAALVELRDRLPAEVTLLVGGGGAASLETGLNHPGIRVLAKLEQLRSALRSPHFQGTRPATAVIR